MTQNIQPEQPAVDPQQAVQALDADQGVAPGTDAVGRPSTGVPAPVQQNPQQADPAQPAGTGQQAAASQGRAQGEVIGQGAPGENSSQIKDPEQWATGDEPMTDSQRSYLDSLAKQAGETLPGNLTKAQASEQIDRLQQATGRAQN
ncbi:DUF3072 domain-containing protein [Luteococcus peritonei]|uniref:DUF3072 domain-containing protein n=1 Tax=Luteococcus peritonei TaxID=88874 RepID=A0ABW4RUD0_9ACTN